MKQSFEERKSNYISYITCEYRMQENKSIRKVFPSVGYEFIATNKYETTYHKKVDLKEELIIKPTLGKYVIVIMLVVFIIISAMKLMDMWYINILVFVFCATVLIILTYIKIGKRVIVINPNSIFIKDYGDIEWADVIMTYFKIYYDDGEYKVHSLIIHYFDMQSDYFKASEIRFRGLSAGPEEVAIYIDRFSKGL